MVSHQCNDALGSPPEWSFLNGRRIVDCSELLPGPYASTLLADLGADVIKVERPAGDPTRRSPTRFGAVNRNKRSVVLDLKTGDGCEAFLGLAATADAVVEGFRPGVLDRLGVGWNVLRRVNERLVLCSLSGFGQDGPYADKPGHDLNFLGLSGYFAAPGTVDGGVVRPGVRIADMLGGLYGALSLAVALASVDRTGRGQHLDLSLTEAAVAAAAPFVLGLPDGRPATEADLVMGDNDVFRTADGRELVFACFEDKSWRAFREDLAAEFPEFPELATAAWDERAARTSARAEVSGVLRRVFAARPRGWWDERLTALGLPWTPVVADRDELLSHPLLVEREVFGALPDTPGTALPDTPATRYARFPTRFSDGLDTVRRPPPQLGEHTAELLGQDQDQNRNSAEVTA
ncbi:MULTISPECIES: CaiB/BaiF CoA-transferase family protein [unclassified Streptomyces]|uniref:CaiB/BaiF CoA transferase family protein n=1 Tax=unclassified Streptomyces TaxID=2593676 RepID=UPI00278C8B0E|nr:MULTISPECIES: CoA transferase [unclassified Streptomyces]